MVGRRAWCRGLAGLVLVLAAGGSTAAGPWRLEQATGGTWANLTTTVTGPDNTAVTVTLPGAPQTRVRLYTLWASCAAAPTTPTPLTVETPPGTVVWRQTDTYTTGQWQVTFGGPGLIAPVGASVVVTFGACGGAAPGIPGTLSVHAERW